MIQTTIRPMEYKEAYRVFKEDSLEFGGYVMDETDEYIKVLVTDTFKGTITEPIVKLKKKLGEEKWQLNKEDVIKSLRVLSLLGSFGSLAIGFSTGQYFYGFLGFTILMALGTEPSDSAPCPCCGSHTCTRGGI